MIRWLALVIAAVLDVALAVLLLAPRPAPVIHPLAPPLTRIDALGDATLGPEVRSGRGGDLLVALEALERQSGTRVHGARLPAGQAERLHSLVEASNRARVQVEEDALALADVLGPDRVGRILEARKEASDAVGEGAAWERVVETLAR